MDATPDIQFCYACEEDASGRVKDMTTTVMVNGRVVKVVCSAWCCDLCGRPKYDADNDPVAKALEIAHAQAAQATQKPEEAEAAEEAQGYEAVTYRPLVYMCHPYSSDPHGNVRRSMHKWDELMSIEAFDVINPLWSHAQHCEINRDYDFWLEYDMRLIERCDAVYRVAGDSPGADREVAHAQRFSIPVFTELSNLLKWCDDWKRPSPAITETIQHDRQAIYGDPIENHRGIAMQWAPMLQPHWQAIRDMVALPPHVIALLMGLVKINRMRRVFHADNYDDLEVYLNTFAREWQEKGLT